MLEKKFQLLRIIKHDIVCLILLFLSLFSYAQVDDPDARFFQKQAKFGVDYNFKDTFVFDDAKSFWGSNAFVKLRDKWGLVNQVGKLVTPFEFSDIKEFDSKIVAVKNDTAWALFDRETLSVNGDFLYQNINFISDSIIIIKQDGKHGIINSYGSMICPPIYDEIFSLKNNIGFAKCDNLWALIDSRGKRWSNFIYHKVKEIVANNCFVNNGIKWYLITHRGREIVKQEKGFEQVENFNEGRAIVKNNTITVFIDTAGRLINLKKKYADLGVVANGYCWVYLNKKKGWLLYNLKTNQEFENKFVIEDGLPFTDDIAWAKQDDRWGMIDKSGVMKTPFVFQKMLASGIPNIVWVDVAGSGYIGLNEQGVYAFKENKMYREVRLFNNNLAEVNDGYGWGLINPQGKLYIPCFYDNITNFSIGKGFVKLNDKWALCNKNGKFIKARIRKSNRTENNSNEE